MALSGMVYKTRRCGEDVVVLLVPVEDETGQTSPVGQRRLIIEKCTIDPLPGDVIWGGDALATLERGVNNKRQMYYNRKGYTRLVEAFDVSGAD